MAAAAQLPSSHGLRGPTYSTLFGLLAVTGLRIGEAMGLDGRDVGTDEALLHIRHAKNGGHRLMPVTPCTADRLGEHRSLQTGLRVSELIGLDIGDVRLAPRSQAHVHCRGKGRKERATPLRSDSIKALSEWLRERAGSPDEPLFVSNRQGRFSRDAIERIVRKYTRIASETCPSLKNKRVSPHCLCHSAAMELLRSGVGCTVIAL